jgi:hypothetical protein
MPKQPTILVAVRVPADLVERVDARGSRTEVVLEGLRVLLDGVRPSVWQEADVILLDHATARADAAERRVATLEAEVAGLRVALLRKLPVGAVIGGPVQSVDPKTHHPSGPVLASAVPTVAGVATGYHPKASWNPSKAKGKPDAST